MPSVITIDPTDYERSTRLTLLEDAAPERVPGVRPSGRLVVLLAPGQVGYVEVALSKNCDSAAGLAEQA